MWWLLTTQIGRLSPVLIQAITSLTSCGRPLTWMNLSTGEVPLGLLFKLFPLRASRWDSALATEIQMWPRLILTNPWLLLVPLARTAYLKSSLFATTTRQPTQPSGARAQFSRTLQLQTTLDGLSQLISTTQKLKNCSLMWLALFRSPTNRPLLLLRTMDTNYSWTMASPLTHPLL